MTPAEAKFRCYVACGWGLVVAFAMVGVLLGRQAGVYIAVIAAVMWVLNRIIREASDSLRLLGAIKGAEEETAKKNGDDDSPPGPPADA